jgi:arylamine N-acetyltransferase
MLPVDEILEALDLSRAEPGIGFLQALFSRFNTRVPFESASKIVRHAHVVDPAEKPRRPEIFWSDHVELGTGGTCFARVAAFDALARVLGFSTRKVLGRVERDFDHAALLIEGPGGVTICDVGFPLPALLPAREARVEGAIVDLEVRPTARGFRIALEAGVPEGPRALEIFDAEVSDEEFEARWRATFDPQSRFLSKLLLRRQEQARVVSYARGQVHVDDRHARLTVPIGLPRAERLASLFEMDKALLESAIARTGEPESASGAGSLTAYLETSATVSEAFAAVASPAAYRRLLEGVARVVEEEPIEERGWRLALAPPGIESANAGDFLREEVWPDPARQLLRIRRRSGLSAFESQLRAQERGGKTYLIREAFFESSREDLLRNDSLRGRLAAGLAVDLLAWARLVQSSKFNV